MLRKSKERGCGRVWRSSPSRYWFIAAMQTTQNGSGWQVVADLHFKYSAINKKIVWQIETTSLVFFCCLDHLGTNFVDSMSVQLEATKTTALSHHLTTMFYPSDA